MRNDSFNALHINNVYSYCLWKRGELDHMSVTVVSGSGKEHTFHQRKLQEKKRHIGMLLTRNLRPDMMRSVSAVGRPWMLMRTGRDGMPMGVLENVDKLMALGQACGWITVWMDKVEGLEQPVAFVVVEDIRFRHWMYLKRKMGYGK